MAKGVKGKRDAIHRIFKSMSLGRGEREVTQKIGVGGTAKTVPEEWLYSWGRPLENISIRWPWKAKSFARSGQTANPGWVNGLAAIWGANEYGRHLLRPGGGAQPLHNHIQASTPEAEKTFISTKTPMPLEVTSTLVSNPLTEFLKLWTPNASFLGGSQTYD